MIPLKWKRIHSFLALVTAVLCVGWATWKLPTGDAKQKAFDADTSLKSSEHTGAESARFGPLRLEGSPDFIIEITAALELLREKSPEDYDFVVFYISGIREGKRSGVNAESRFRWITLARPTWNYSRTWLSSVLVHEAMHAKLFDDAFLASRGGFPEVELYAGSKAEKQCMELQERVLTRIGGSNKEILHLRQQDGMHGDVNRDGKLDMRDYELRRW